MYNNDPDLMIDEIFTFYLAGTSTTQVTTSNLIMYLCMDKNQHLKQKLNDEMMPVVEEAKENLVENLEYQTVMDLEYLGNCFYESLRIEAPTISSGETCMMHDVTLKNGVTIKKGSMFMLGIEASHTSTEQWHEPFEYIPERF